jgi:hypothetical protein
MKKKLAKEGLVVALNRVIVDQLQIRPRRMMLSWNLGEIYALQRMYYLCSVLPSNILALCQVAIMSLMYQRLDNFFASMMTRKLLDQDLVISKNHKYFCIPK